MKARIKATGEVCDVLSVFLDKKNGRYGFFSLDEIEVIPDEPEKEIEFTGFKGTVSNLEKSVIDGLVNAVKSFSKEVYGIDLDKIKPIDQETAELVENNFFDLVGDNKLTPEQSINDEILANDGMKPDNHELVIAVDEMMVNFGLEKGNHSNPVDRERDK